MTARIHRAVTVHALIVVAVCAMACGAGSSVEARRAERAVIEPSLEKPVAAARHVKHPVALVLLQDQTGSRTITRTEQFTPQSLDVPIGLVEEFSGKLVFGVIRETGKPMVRLVVPPGPRPPSKPAPGNAFDMLESNAVYERELAAYHEAARKWRGDVDTRVATFKKEVIALLTAPTLSTRSAVWEAIFRADVALAEPEVGRTSEGSRFIVLASDAQDTTRKAGRPLRSGAQVVVANGVGTAGSLSAVPGVKVFEGLGAAVAWVCDLERSRVHSPRGGS